VDIFDAQDQTMPDITVTVISSCHALSPHVRGLAMATGDEFTIINQSVLTALSNDFKMAVEAIVDNIWARLVSSEFGDI
jgi:hypothetical protein